MLTAFVHAGVQRASRQRFEEAAGLEKALIDLLRETDPDMGEGETSVLHLRLATQRLRDDGHRHALPVLLRRIVSSIAADGRGEGGGGGSLGLRGRDGETLQVTLQREWNALARLAELRRAADGRLLDHLLASLPQGSRGTDLLAETTQGKLLSAVRSDMTLRSEVRDEAMARLMGRALLWLHEQEVIRLNKGLTVFRPAMTIRLRPVRRGFANTDFASLNPNPPMRSGLGVGTRGEGRGPRRPALDSDKWGRWRPLVVVGGADGGPGQRRWGWVGGTACRGRQSWTGPVRLCGSVG